MQILIDYRSELRDPAMSIIMPFLYASAEDIAFSDDRLAFESITMGGNTKTVRRSLCAPELKYADVINNVVQPFKSFKTARYFSSLGPITLAIFCKKCESALYLARKYPEQIGLAVICAFKPENINIFETIFANYQGPAFEYDWFLHMVGDEFPDADADFVTRAFAFVEHGLIIDRKPDMLQNMNMISMPRSYEFLESYIEGSMRRGTKVFEMPIIATILSVLFYRRAFSHVIRLHERFNFRIPSKFWNLPEIMSIKEKYRIVMYETDVFIWIFRRSWIKKTSEAILYIKKHMGAAALEDIIAIEPELAEFLDIEPFYSMHQKFIDGAPDFAIKK